jgi:hypothetical protein
MLIRTRDLLWISEAHQRPPVLTPSFRKATFLNLEYRKVAFLNFPAPPRPRR